MKKIRMQTLEEALDELKKLENADRIVPLGEWSYPAILSHLRFFIEGSMKGFPESRSSFIKTTVGPNLFRNMKQIGYMPSGFRNSFLQKNESYENPGIELIKLRDAINSFINHRGSLAEHPIFGKLSTEEWHLVHAYHIANHLNFLNYGKKTSAKKSASKKKTSAAKKKNAPASKKSAGKKSSKTPVKKSIKKSPPKKRTAAVRRK